MASGMFALALFLLGDLALGEGGHGQHCPWTNHWEWSGMFQVQEGDWLSWNVEKGENGEYAMDSMKIIVLGVSQSSVQTLEDLEDMAENLFHGNLTTAASGVVLLPGAAYLLSFSQDLWLSQFKIQAPVGGKLAFFTEHLPEEFENKLHYLKAADGSDVEPMEEESSMECADMADAGIEPVKGLQEKRWAEVIGASFLTIIPSIFGIAVLAASFSKQLSSWGKKALQFANSSACGVVFAAAIFLLMPESIELVSAGKESESLAAGVWGAAVIGGWFLGVMIDHSCSIVTWMWSQTWQQMSRKAVGRKLPRTEILKSQTAQAAPKSPRLHS
ncbi:unnamed protein product [Polarella glacialis]|uniref:Uncharacterized protein n=1 Tax=Polarella glacialis TaxID=89957 RepID=A0A813DRN2_POLGL|nr:unnamed protein product [Polarella glacialis]